jgi:hypothetical protein
MANKIIWDARPTASELIAATGVLKNLANAATAISPTDVANGTALNTYADFLLYLHDFAAAPTAGGYFECHIIYEFNTTYGDGEDGDLAGTPNLTGNTLVGVFPVKASDEDQYIQLMGVPIRPHDFRVLLVNKCGQAIPNTDGSTLNIFTYCDEVQG